MLELQALFLEECGRFNPQILIALYIIYIVHVNAVCINVHIFDKASNRHDMSCTSVLGKQRISLLQVHIINKLTQVVILATTCNYQKKLLKVSMYGLKQLKVYT